MNICKEEDTNYIGPEAFQSLNPALYIYQRNYFKPI